MPPLERAEWAMPLCRAPGMLNINYIILDHVIIFFGHFQ